MATHQIFTDVTADINTDMMVGLLRGNHPHAC